MPDSIHFRLDAIEKKLKELRAWASYSDPQAAIKAGLLVLKPVPGPLEIRVKEKEEADEQRG